MNRDPLTSYKNIDLETSRGIKIITIWMTVIFIIATLVIIFLSKEISDLHDSKIELEQKLNNCSLKLEKERVKNENF